MRINVQVPGVSVPDPDRTVSIPPHSPLPGVYTSLQPLSPSHSASLFANIAGAANAHLWTFFPQYVPTEQSVLDALVAEWIAMPGNQMYAILPTNGTGAAHGIVCMHRIVPGDRCLEIGRIIYGPALARTRAATETIFLLLRHAFDDLGYSRVEWKANALNAPSLKAAERLGFVSEGLFRKHIICKGKWRDTAWFSITDDEWPAVKRGLEVWLDASNFDDEGQQKRGLRECRDAGK